MRIERLDLMQAVGGGERALDHAAGNVPERGEMSEIRLARLHANQRDALVVETPDAHHDAGRSRKELGLEPEPSGDNGQRRLQPVCRRPVLVQRPRQLQHEPTGHGRVAAGGPQWHVQRVLAHAEGVRQVRRGHTG